MVNSASANPTLHAVITGSQSISQKQGFHSVPSARRKGYRNIVHGEGEPFAAKASTKRPIVAGPEAQCVPRSRRKCARKPVSRGRRAPAISLSRPFLHRPRTLFLPFRRIEARRRRSDSGPKRDIVRVCSEIRFHQGRKSYWYTRPPTNPCKSPP